MPLLGPLQLFPCQKDTHLSVLTSLLSYLTYMPSLQKGLSPFVVCAYTIWHFLVYLLSAPLSLSDQGLSPSNSLLHCQVPATVSCTGKSWRKVC